MLPVLGPPWCHPGAGFTPEALKRLDQQGHVYQVQQVPRGRVNSAVSELREVGLIAEACAQANHGYPLLCMAYDHRKSFGLLNDVLCGLVGQDDLSEYPFWKDCKPGPAVDLPCWPFRHMLFKDSHVVLGGSDPRHMLKVWAVWARSSA